MHTVTQLQTYSWEPGQKAPEDKSLPKKHGKPWPHLGSLARFDISVDTNYNAAAQLAK